MKLKEIQNLIKFVARSGASEVKLEMEDVKITIKTSDESPQVVVQEPIVVPQQQVAVSPVPVAAAPTESVSDTPTDPDSSYITVKSHWNFLPKTITR